MILDVVLFGLVLAWVYGVSVWLHRRILTDVQDIAKAAPPPAVVGPPLLPVVPPVARAGPPPRPDPVVRISLCSGSGRALDTFTLPSTARRPRIVRAGHVFQCSHQEINGTWVYRRVHVEPPARG